MTKGQLALISRIRASHKDQVGKCRCWPEFVGSAQPFDAAGRAQIVAVASNNKELLLAYMMEWVEGRKGS